MNTMKVKLGYNELALIFAILLATQYFVISGIIIKAAIQISCFLLLMFICVIQHNRFVLKWINLFWLISIIPFFYSVHDWTAADLRDFIGYFSFITLVILVKCDYISLNRAIRLLYAMAIFHVAFVFIHVLLKSQFTSFIYAIIDSGAVSTFNRAVKGNYHTGFGYIPGDTSGYLINGIFILLFSNRIVSNKHRYLWSGVLFLGVLFCGKRSHLLCLVISIMLVWMITASGSKKAKRIVLSIVIVISAFTLGYMLLPFFSNIPMLNRISLALDRISNGQDFTSNRTNLTIQAMQFFTQNKLLGIGWKSFNQYTFNKWGYTNYVNNVYMQLLTETGIVGAVLFILPMMISLYATIKKAVLLTRQKNRDINAMNYLSLSLALQIFFLTYCFLEIPFYDFTFLLVYGVAIVISNCVVVKKISAV